MAREYMKAAKDLRVSGPLSVKPTLDELPVRIQEPEPRGRLRLISEIHRQRSQLSQATTAGQIVDLLSEFGLAKQSSKPTEVAFRAVTLDDDKLSTL